MSQKVSLRLFSLPAITFFLQLHFLLVSSDLRVVDTWNNKVVFQTASDFVRTGCGSFVNRSYLIVSDPLDACNVPTGPPTGGLLSKISDVLFGNDEAQNNQWILLASGEECDLKTKFRNAASAGYSSIIVGTDDAHEDIVKPGLLGEGDEEFIDVHLVNALDTRVLSKQFAHPMKYLVDPPSPSRCKEEYQKTWLRSRYVSLARRVWKKSMEICWNFLKGTLFMMGRLTIGIKSCMPSVFHNRDTYSSIAVFFASIVFSITIMMIVSIQNSAKKLSKYKSVQHDPPPSFEKPSISKPKTEEDWSDSSSSSSYESFRSTPKRPNSNSFTPSSHRGIPIDYTFYHRINLDIKINEPLTRSRVNNAYRDMALKYHPDKNRHLNERELQKITEEFRVKKKSRDVLLQYCQY